MASQQGKRPHYIHRLSYSAQEKVVGLFVLLAAVIFFAVFVINSRSLHLFDDYIQLQLYVQNAEGVSRDTPVRISGIEVGRVDSVEITPEHLVLITVRVYDRYTSMLRTNSRASIKLSLLGRTTIDLSAGNPNLPTLEDGTSLVVEEPISIDELLAQVAPMVDTVNVTLNHFSELLLAVKPGDVETLIGNTAAITTDLQAIIQKVAAGEGLIGHVLFDPEFQQQATRLLDHVEQTLLTAEARLGQLEPLLEALEPLLAETNKTIPHLPALMSETLTLLEYVNATLVGLQPEVQQLPDMIHRINVLMEQTDFLMNRVSDSWWFSRGRTAPQQRIEVIPHD
ncbi:MAG: MCE family protein [Idiomarina sp.]|nr:MCE family protein [Idiomarina sp.]